jgi:anti-sigma regulatory factor (Ser/Thr protein kinase)
VSPSPRAVDEPNPLHLDPRPSAARQAREWVSGVLSDWPEEEVAMARLLVSELVTNAVLHAGTAIEVTYKSEGGRARFDVRDYHRGGPVAKRFAPDSPTGRGMRLISALAEEWGVEREGDGKTVWFAMSAATQTTSRHDRVIISSAGGEPAHGSPEPTGREHPRGGAGDTHGPAGRHGGVDTVDVKVLGLPVEVYLEAEQHNDAVVRELTLIVQSAGTAGGVDVPRRLLDLAAEVRATFSPASDGLRAQVEEAIRRGDQTVDIHVSVPRHGWEALLRLADWLDEVDRYSVGGDLLTLESTPRLRRFRSWFAQQVSDQMRGLPATPWEPTP